MKTLRNQHGQSVRLEGQLGSGGEGNVYRVFARRDLVAKLYHPTHRTPERAQKLATMLAHPPEDPTRAWRRPHVSIAWPIGALFEGDQFAGFMMPNAGQGRPIFSLLNPRQRQQHFADFNWRSLHHAGRNLAIAVQALHAAGYVIGDVNQKNILIDSRALVTVVDTDSFQVTGPGGRVFRCPVGLPDYTPPELQGQRFDEVDRAPAHDRFGLAVLLFQLLMEGHHPFMGKPRNPDISLPGEFYLDCIRSGDFPYVGESKNFEPSPHAPRFETLHPRVQNLFITAFVRGHSQPSARPTAAQWSNALGEAGKALVKCRANREHWYSDHLATCPWCERARRQAQKAARPRPAQPQQIPLPAPRFPAPSTVPSYNLPSAAAYATPRPAAGALPPEARGLSWGGLFLNLFWALAHRLWWAAALMLVPVVNLLVPFVLLFKGNQWAWERNGANFSSAGHFRRVQRLWAGAGVAAFTLLVLFTFNQGIGPATIVETFRVPLSLEGAQESIQSSEASPLVPAPALGSGGALAPAPSVAAPAAGPERAVPSPVAPPITVDVARANIRAGPGETYGIIDRLPRGTLLEVVGMDGSAAWYKVRLPDGRQGWIGSSIVTAAAAPAD